jgi:nucleoside-diphosphate-sugar epimerase
MGIAIAPSKILVTGANGYIAMWVVDTLLKSGYSVRGTVRSQSRTKDLEKTFSSFVDEGKLEFAIVDDIVQVTVFVHDNMTEPSRTPPLPGRGV